MSQVDQDTQMAMFMSMTNCDDFDLCRRLLQDNAWCLEIAVEAFNRRGGTGNSGSSSSNSSGNYNANTNTNTNQPPAGSFGAFTGSSGANNNNRPPPQRQQQQQQQTNQNSQNTNNNNTSKEDDDVAFFVGATGCSDPTIAKQLLEQNAYCMELAMEMYQSLYANGARGGAGNNNANSNRHDQQLPVGMDGTDQPLPGTGSTGTGRHEIQQMTNHRQTLRQEQNPTNRIFESQELQSLFKAPPYVEHIEAGVKGWRGVFEKASKEKKYVIINVQEQGNFWSHRLDRDVWSSVRVENVVRCDYLMMQIWKGSDNYQSMDSAYHLQQSECPLILICDGQSRMELDRFTYNTLMRKAGLAVGGVGNAKKLQEEAVILARTLEELLTDFVERQRRMSREQSVDGASSSASPGSFDRVNSETSTGNQNQNQSSSTDNTATSSSTTTTTTTTRDSSPPASTATSTTTTTTTTKAPEGNEEDEDSLDAALRLSASMTTTPDDSVDTLSSYRVTEKGEGILKLRIKLSIDGGLVDWDILVPKTTPQRAFTTGVRYEMKTNRSTENPKGQFISVTMLDRSRKLATIFAENPAEAKADPNSGATLGDVATLRSGEVLYVEYAAP